MVMTNGRLLRQELCYQTSIKSVLKTVAPCSEFRCGTGIIYVGERDNLNTS